MADIKTCNKMKKMANTAILYFLLIIFCRFDI
jgi:hypothetical protein